jgi:putative tricarboxylic transport membrane protein
MNAFLRKGDFWSGLALAALGAYILSEARHWDYVSEDGPGAGFFPMWYGGAMIVLSLLVVAGAVLKVDPSVRGIRWPEVRRAMTCWLAFAVAIGLLHLLGFAVVFGLLTWFIAGVMFGRPLKIALPLAIGGALIAWGLFSWALDLSLPTGSLFGSMF